jgi:hypothetical protein
VVPHARICAGGRTQGRPHHNPVTVYTSGWTLPPLFEAGESISLRRPFGNPVAGKAMPLYRD